MDTFAINYVIKCLTEIKEIGNESTVVASNYLVFVYSMDTYALNISSNALQRSKKLEIKAYSCCIEPFSTRIWILMLSIIPSNALQR